jgi:hypothetical protein
MGDYSDSTKSFAEVATSAYKGDFEVMFGDMMNFISRS